MAECSGVSRSRVSLAGDLHQTQGSRPAAQEAGAIGVLIFTDPGDDGEITEANGYEAYPAGPARQPSSVQRGSVQFVRVA